MAQGVECRYPFLDERVYEHSMRTPAAGKLDGLDDKVALREVARRLLPESIAARAKQPYRAPEVAPFFDEPAPEWVDDRLSAAAVEEVGVFDSAKVEGLLRRCRAGRAGGVREGMALVGILSTQLWYDSYFGGQHHYDIEDAEPKVLLMEDRSAR
jgi:asparagine synthase (glutamine-hydrolysing)